MSTSYIKRQIRRVHVVVVQWTSKKCTKKGKHGYTRYIGVYKVYSTTRVNMSTQDI